ncbi:MAG: DUF4294 domain-containing protein [Bacteroidota bacterium]
MNFRKNIPTWIGVLLIFGFTFSGNAQTSVEKTEKVTINGHVFTAFITGEDTIIMADLQDISISSPRKFKNRADYRRYRKYRYYGAKVYPYAQKAIKIFQEVEDATQNMRKRKRKRYIRKKYKQLKREFKAPLKNLTKTQGKILIKMIEKELDKPFYDLMKGMRGGFTAGYWHQLGKFYDYNLKEGYQEGADPILDAVLHDFDISYKKD